MHVRAEATSDSPSLLLLRPGQSLDHDGSVPRRHRVVLKGGGVGFVSNSWTELVPDPATTATGFAVHFLDVGIGDSAIIGMGDREIVIDGGDSTRPLGEYVGDSKGIDPPIELVVVIHGDTDHWKGLTRLLGFDDMVDEPPAVQEFWDPGYDRNCDPPDQPPRQKYLRFIDDMRKIVPERGFRRLLEKRHTPAVVSGTPEPFTVTSLPGITFALLYSDSTPETGDCPYLINNASIVLMVEVGGVRLFFTGDANGKEREPSSSSVPGLVKCTRTRREEAPRTECEASGDSPGGCSQGVSPRQRDCKHRSIYQGGGSSVGDHPGQYPSPPAKENRRRAVRQWQTGCAQNR